jgi:uncharacterized protein YndB with AHSA1/START domain
MKSNITGNASVTINAPIDKVWEALTRPELIKKYFFNTDTETDWKVGSPIRFSGTYEGKEYHDKGTVLAIEQNKLIQYKYWSSMSGIEDKPENYVTISYRLSGDNKKTKLEITQENIPDEKTKKHSEENWQMVLGNLKKMVEGSNEVLAF